MKLRVALEEKLLDVRVRDRLVAEGKLSKEDLKKYLDGLSDDKDISEVVEAPQSDSSVDEDALTN